MDTESSSPTQSPGTTEDEFEGLQVTEFDENDLWELLHDEPGEEKVESDGGAPAQAMEAVGTNPNSIVESYWCLDDVTDNVEDFNWFHVMEETSVPCDDVEGWYGGSAMEEMNEILAMRDYSFSHSAIMCDEIGYIGLWQDS